MQIAPFLCYMIVFCLACLAVLYFFTLFRKWYNFWKKIKMCFDFPQQLLSETFLILRIIQQGIVKFSYRVYRHQSTHYSCQISIKLEFS